MCKNDVYAGSWKGELGVWQLNPARKALTTKYIMERESLPHISLRQLSAVVEHKGKCYLGDGGPNIKVLDWKKSKYVFPFIYVKLILSRSLFQQQDSFQLYYLSMHTLHVHKS